MNNSLSKGSTVAITFDFKDADGVTIPWASISAVDGKVIESHNGTELATYALDSEGSDKVRQSPIGDGYYYVKVEGEVTAQAIGQHPLRLDVRATVADSDITDGTAELVGTYEFGPFTDNSFAS